MQKDDKPHRKGSSSDKAHDVVEENERIMRSMKNMSKKKTRKMLQHLMDYKGKGQQWRRNPQNQAMGKGEDLEKKQGVPKGTHPKKMESCIMQLKRKRGVDSPHAVCSASLQGKTKKSDCMKKALDYFKSKKLQKQMPPPSPADVAPLPGDDSFTTGNDPAPIAGTN